MMEDIIEKAKAWALEEIEKHDHPSLMNFDTANEKGQELAEKINADKDTVLLGTILMDIKLGECFKSENRRDHTKEGAIAAKEFLEDNNVEKEIIKKVVNCVEAHHGEVPFTCKEAEICANADCYRFLLPHNLVSHMARNRGRGKSFEEVVKFANKKLEEKHNLLSLDICKEELEPYYKMFKELIEKAKE